MHLLQQLVVDHVLDLGLLEQILQVVGRHVHALVRLAFKRVGALVELDGDRAVVHLVRDGKGGVVVVGGADKPQAVGDGELAVVERLGVGGPPGGHQVEHPLVVAGHLQHRQDLGKVVLHAGEVHLVEHDHGRVLAQTRLVHGAEELGLVEALGELVKVAEHLRAVAEAWLHRHDGRGVIQVAAKAVGQRGLTGTRDALQDQQLGGGHAGHKATDNLGRVVELHLAARKCAEAVDEVLERDGVVIDRRLPVAVLEVDERQLGEAVGLGDLFFLGKSLGLDGGLGHGGCGILDALAIERERRVARHDGRGALARGSTGTRSGAHDVTHRGQVVVGQGRGAHVRNLLGAAHGIDLERQQLVLLVHEVEHLLVEAADLAVERLVGRIVAMQAAVDAIAVYQDGHDQHGDRDEHGKQNDRADLAHQVKRGEVGHKDVEVLNPAKHQQVKDGAHDGNDVVDDLCQQLPGKSQKLTHRRCPPACSRSSPPQPRPSDGGLPRAWPRPGRAARRRYRR